jgi:hypothetical protein
MNQRLRDRIARVREQLGVTGATERERRIDLDIGNAVASTYFEGYELPEENIQNAYKTLLGLMTHEDAVNAIRAKHGLPLICPA